MFLKIMILVLSFMHGTIFIGITLVLGSHSGTNHPTTNTRVMVGKLVKSIKFRKSSFMIWWANNSTNHKRKCLMGLLKRTVNFVKHK